MSNDQSSENPRGDALVAAEHDREAATEDAEMEYSEVVHKARDHFEAEVAEASAHRLERVTPAYRAYNAAVITAEEEEAEREEG